MMTCSHSIVHGTHLQSISLKADPINETSKDRKFQNKSSLANHVGSQHEGPDEANPDKKGPNGGHGRKGRKEGSHTYGKYDGIPTLL